MIEEITYETAGGAIKDILARERIQRYKQDYMDTRYIVSVDLGTLQDHTAISILRSNLNRLEIVHLERLPLGISYVDIIKRIKSLMNHPKLRGKSTLIIDSTGIGRPVLDMIRDSNLPCKGITITGGGKARQEYRKGKALDNFYAPKQDLVSALQVLMENKKL